MAHAEKCPICDGSGKTKVGKKKFPCYGCDGRGWVEVGDSFSPMPSLPTSFPLTPYPFPEPGIPWGPHPYFRLPLRDTTCPGPKFNL